MIDVYFENHKKYLNTLRGQNAEMLNVKSGDNVRAYEECRLLGCGAVQILWIEPTFRRNVLPPSSG
jgi:hypothetical protein